MKNQRVLAAVMGLFAGVWTVSSLLGQARAELPQGGEQKKIVYCRIAGPDFDVLDENILDEESPKDPKTGNRFLRMDAKSQTAAQKSITITVTRLPLPMPQPQFQTAIYVAGKPFMKSSRQDLTIYTDFYIDEVRHRLACFDEIE